MHDLFGELQLAAADPDPVLAYDEGLLAECLAIAQTLGDPALIEEGNALCQEVYGGGQPEVVVPDPNSQPGNQGSDGPLGECIAIAQTLDPSVVQEAISLCNEVYGESQNRPTETGDDQLQLCLDGVAQLPDPAARQIGESNCREIYG